MAEKEQVLTLDKVNNQIAKITLKMESGDIDIKRGRAIIEGWRALIYGIEIGLRKEHRSKELELKEKELEYKLREVTCTEQELELKAEDQKAIDDLLSTIKTGLKDLDKKPTEPKTTKGGGKRCQKK